MRHQIQPTLRTYSTMLDIFCSRFWTPVSNSQPWIFPSIKENQRLSESWREFLIVLSASVSQPACERLPWMQWSGHNICRVNSLEFSLETSMGSKAFLLCLEANEMWFAGWSVEASTQCLRSIYNDMIIIQSYARLVNIMYAISWLQTKEATTKSKCFSASSSNR